MKLSISHETEQHELNLEFAIGVKEGSRVVFPSIGKVESCSENESVSWGSLRVKINKTFVFVVGK